MEISLSEFSEWIQFLNSEPSADQKRSYEAANICLVIARAMGGNKKAKLEDFLLKYNTSTKKTTSAESLKAKIWAWVGVEKRKRGL